MSIIVIESVVLCLLFTLMVYFMSREPIRTLYNYPPRIQERVMSLDEYKDRINRFFAFSDQDNCRRVTEKILQV